MDHRCYELVEDTVEPAFSYRYFVLRDRSGKCAAVQPFFVMDVDLLTAAGTSWRHFASIVRRFWPHFMLVRSLMVGCSGGPGALGGKDEQIRRQCAEQLLDAALSEARRAAARQVVLKEFPRQDSNALRCFLDRGFLRIPRLEPLDLYVRHSSPLINAVFRLFLPLVGAVSRDKTLARFANYKELWG